MRHRLAVLTATAALSLGAVSAGSASAAEPAPAAGAAVATASVATASAQPATAAPESKRGLRCVAAGVNTLISLGLLRDAALRRVDYSTLADPVNGPIFTSLPAGSYLSLGEVIRLHVTSPQLFAWCR